MADLTFGLGIAGMALLGVIALIVAYLMTKQIGKPASNVLKAFGVIAILLAGVSYAGFADWNADPEEIVAQPTYDISVAESEAEVYVNADEHRITVAMSFNDTSDAFVGTTGVVNLNWTVTRSDALLADSVAALSIGAVPTVDIAGAADEYILDQNTDDSFKAKFLKTSGVYNYEKINLLVEAGESAWSNVTITLNADAVAAMSQYDSVMMYIYIGGEAWTITFEKAVIST